MDEVQPWTKLEADAIRFLLCHRRSLKLDSSYSSSSIDELWQLTSSTQSITGTHKILTFFWPELLLRSYFIVYALIYISIYGSAVQQDSLTLLSIQEQPS